MIKEFKEFALKGNMLDLAIGVIIGGAFSGIVNSIVNDLIMPLLSLVTGRIDFSNMFLSLIGVKYDTLKEAQEAGAATFNYGSFITQLINFLILAFVVFIIVKQLNKLKRPVVVEVTTKECPHCLTTINSKARKCPNCTSDLLLEE
jgi:large conductance mechanosensitive channel